MGRIVLLWHSSKPTSPGPAPFAVPDGAARGGALVPGAAPAASSEPALSPARPEPLARKRPRRAGLCGTAGADWPARRARGPRGTRRGGNRCGAGPGQRQRSGWIWQWRLWGARARRRSTSRSAMKWPRSARSCSWTSWRSECRGLGLAAGGRGRQRVAGRLRLTEGPPFGEILSGPGAPCPWRSAGKARLWSRALPGGTCGKAARCSLGRQNPSRRVSAETLPRELGRSWKCLRLDVALGSLV